MRNTIPYSPSTLLRAITAFAILFAGCHMPTDEARVRKVVSDIRKAVEEKDIGTVLGYLSKTYRDPRGNDREGIKGLLAFYFFRPQAVSVYIANHDVTVQGAAARSTFQAVLSGRGADAASVGVLPEAMGAYDFDVSFAKEDGEWKAVSAAWKRSGYAPSQ